MAEIVANFELRGECPEVEIVGVGIETGDMNTFDSFFERIGQGTISRQDIDEMYDICAGRRDQITSVQADSGSSRVIAALCMLFCAANNPGYQLYKHPSRDGFEYQVNLGGFPHR